MILKNSTMQEFMSNSQGKMIVAFGDGLMLQDMLKLESEYQIVKHIEFIIDNDKRKWGRPIYTPFGRILNVFSVDKLLEYDADKLMIIITSERYPEMIQQLDDMAELDLTECYIYPIMHSFEHRKYQIPKYEGDYLIPPVIHYCWFGKNDFPDNVKKCMESWEKKCPHYEIIRWDESNYNVNKNPYISEAYKAGAYAYVSDYARLDILYQNGGIYLDTDIELLKPLDELRRTEAFGGFLHHGARIDTGIGFGSICGNELLKEFMSLYYYEKYIGDGGVNRNLNAASVTKVLKYYGLKQDGSYQVIKGMACYPREFFDPLSYVLGIDQRTEDTYSVHYGNMSWSDEGYYSLRNIRKRSKEAKMEILSRLGLRETGR